VTDSEGFPQDIGFAAGAGRRGLDREGGVMQKDGKREKGTGGGALRFPPGTTIFKDRGKGENKRGGAESKKKGEKKPKYGLGKRIWEF